MYLRRYVEKAWEFACARCKKTAADFDGTNFCDYI